jgi:hypothetical protein
VARRRGDDALGIQGRPACQDGSAPEQVLKELPAPHGVHCRSQCPPQQFGERAALRGETRAGNEPQLLGGELEEKAEAGHVIGAGCPNAALPFADQVAVHAGCRLVQQGGDLLKPGNDVILLPAPRQTLQT